MALAMPHKSGKKTPAGSPAATPSRVCPSMIRAVFAAIEISARRPQTSPAPTAGPFLVHLGVGRVQTARIVQHDRENPFRRGLELQLSVFRAGVGHFFLAVRAAAGPQEGHV